MVRRVRQSASRRLNSPSLAAHAREARAPATRAWELAVRWLAAQDRSEQEIRARLTARGFPQGTINSTLRRLHHLHYLDDRRTALGTAERAARDGHGSEYVRAQLLAKGVAEALIDEAIAAAFADELQLARRAFTRRYPVPPERQADRAKAARYLLGRGFPEDVVFAIVGEPC
jgi:regulatory protein